MPDKRAEASADPAIPVQEGGLVRERHVEERRPFGPGIRWLVTARHLAPAHPQGRHPWGTWHLQRDIGMPTACGMATLGWRTFWHLHVEDGSEPLCGACADAVGIAAGEGARRS